MYCTYQSVTYFDLFEAKVTQKKEAFFELFLVYVADSRGISIKCQKCRLVFPTFTDSFCDYVHYISALAYYV